MDSLPDSYHLLRLAGNAFIVDGEVRKEVESFLRTNPTRNDFIIVETLLGEELTVVADYVNVISASTPATRAAARAFDLRFANESEGL